MKLGSLIAVAQIKKASKSAERTVSQHSGHCKKMEFLDSMQTTINKKNILQSFIEFRSYAIIFTFFLIFLIVGLSVYKDYGISWDEPYHRINAFVSVKYIADLISPGSFSQFGNYPPLHDYIAKEYGVVFDLFLFAIEIISGHRENGPELYALRHLFTFLLFYVSSFFFFLTVKNRFASWKTGLLGCLFFILSPRIFAESFYNLKDLVFLSSFTIAIYFLIRFLNKKSLPNAFLFALASALTIDIRIVGIIIPCLGLVFIIVDLIKAKLKAESIKSDVLALLAYTISLVVLTVMFWPYLWQDPFHNFVQAFFHMSRYMSAGNFGMLYMGKIITASVVPWHYIPVWFAITTPIMYSLCFFVGVLTIIRIIFINGWRLYSNENERQDLAFFLLFFGPILAVIVFRSVLYDGWRQMYFIYSSFLLIAMIGLTNSFRLIRKISHRSHYQIAYFTIVACMVLNMTYTFLWMIKFHPHENVYFNLIADKHAAEYFERDYWGLSYREGLEYIAKTDKRKIVKIKADNPHLVLINLFSMRPDDAKRFQMAELPDADYYITGYRMRPDQISSDLDYYSIFVDHFKILSIVKLHKPV